MVLKGQIYIARMNHDIVRRGFNIRKIYNDTPALPPLVTYTTLCSTIYTFKIPVLRKCSEPSEFQKGTEKQVNVLM